MVEERFRRSVEKKFKDVEYEIFRVKQLINGGSETGSRVYQDQDVDASQVQGLENYLRKDVSGTISAQHTFSFNGAPFILGANSRNKTVIGLQADRLNKSVTVSGPLSGGGSLTGNISVGLNHSAPLSVVGGHLGLNFATPLFRNASDQLDLKIATPIHVNTENALGLSYHNPFKVENDKLALKMSAPITQLQSGELTLSYESPLKVVSNKLTLGLINPLGLDANNNVELKFSYPLFRNASNELDVREASTSQTGTVTTGTQSLAGTKTFTGSVRLGNSATLRSSETFANTYNDTTGLYDGSGMQVNRASSKWQATLDRLMTREGILTTGGIGHPGYISQMKYWDINNLGFADFRKIFADELRVKAFTADVSQAFRGSRILTKSFAKLDRNFIVPAVGQTAELIVQEMDLFQGFNLFQDGDFVMLPILDTSDGGLYVGQAWGVVSNKRAYNGSGNEEKLQIWDFTTVDTEPNFTVPVGLVVPGGNEAFSFGSTSSPNGFIEDTVLDSAGSPYTQAVSWYRGNASDRPWKKENWKVEYRLGVLDGIQQASGSGLYSENAFLTGKALIGDLQKQGHYLEYDVDPENPSNGLLMLKGRMIITGGSIDPAQMEGLGSLSGKDSINYNEVGGTKPPANADRTADNIPTTISNGASRANAGLSSAGNIRRVISGANITEGTQVAGLNLTPDYLGYWNGSAWRAFIKSDGSFAFQDASGKGLSLDTTVGSAVLDVNKFLFKTANNNVVIDSESEVFKLGFSAAAVGGSGVYFSGAGDFNLAANANNFLRRVGSALRFRSTDFYMRGGNLELDGANSRISILQGTQGVVTIDDGTGLSSSIRLGSQFNFATNNQPWTPTYFSFERDVTSLMGVSPIAVTGAKIRIRSSEEDFGWVPAYNDYGKEYLTSFRVLVLGQKDNGQWSTVGEPKIFNTKIWYPRYGGPWGNAQDAYDVVESFTFDLNDSISFTPEPIYHTYRLTVDAFTHDIDTQKIVLEELHVKEMLAKTVLNSDTLSARDISALGAVKIHDKTNIDRYVQLALRHRGSGWDNTKVDLYAQYFASGEFVKEELVIGGGGASESHTHDASDINSGVFSYARLPISSAQVTNWEFAFGWGNHSTQGYAKTKADVGLGSVNNWGNSTKAEAEGGTVNNKYMTPLRTAEAITAQSRSSTWTPTWSQVTGKPTSFNPSSHTHPWSEITSIPDSATRGEISVANLETPSSSTLGFISGRRFMAALKWANINDKPTTFAPSAHTHATLTPGDGISGSSYNAGSAQTWSLDGNWLADFIDQVLYGKNYAQWGHTHIWDEIESKPTTATRWPAWSEVTSKPSTFNPSSHTHPWSEITSIPASATRGEISLANLENVSSGTQGFITGRRFISALKWANISDIPSTFAPSSHNHSAGDINSGTLSYDRLPFSSTNVTNWNTAFAQRGSQIAGNGLSWSSNNLNISTVYLDSFMGTYLNDNQYVQTGHTHPWSQITGAPATATRWPSWSEVTSKPSTFAPSSHNHAAGDITSGTFATARIPTVTHGMTNFANQTLNTGSDVTFGRVNVSTFEIENLSGLSDITDGILILCPEGSGTMNDIIGSFYFQRSSGLYNVRKVDVMYSSASSNNNYDAAISFTASNYDTAWNLVRLNYDGGAWIGLRRQGQQHWQSSSYFVGEYRYTGPNRLNWIATGAATNVSTLNYGNMNTSFSSPIDVAGRLNATQIHVDGSRKDSNWDTAFAQRGSNIAGNGLSWASNNLNVSTVWLDTQFGQYLFDNQYVQTGHTHPNLTAGTGLSGDTYNGGNARTWSVDNTVFRTGASIGGNLRFGGSDGRGVRFWDNDNYKIYMSTTGNSTWGGRLDNSSDYNMYFRMAGGTNRGWAFKSGDDVVAQIESDGTGRFSNIIAGNLSIANWNTAYSQRGSNIAGNGLSWSNNNLNVSTVYLDSQIGQYLFDNQYVQTGHTHSNLSTGQGLSGSTYNGGTSREFSLTSIVAGNSTIGALRYNGTTRAGGMLYGGTLAPNGTNRLNYSGYLHATRFIGQHAAANGVPGITANITIETSYGNHNFQFVNGLLTWHENY